MPKVNKLELSPEEENYCLLIADKGMSKRDAYKTATGKNHKSDGAFRAAIMRWHNRKHIKDRIKQLQKETNKIRQQSIKDTIKKINYGKKDAFDDLRELHQLSLDSGNLKTGVSAIDSIIKLLGLSEDLREDIVFKIIGQKKDAGKNSDDTA